MFEFYPQIKAVHIACVLLSRALFAMRGVLVQVGHAGASHWAPLRYLSYTVDTTLVYVFILAIARMHHPLGWLLGWLA
jgi:uncharacterized membrane protein SirB2